MIGNYYSKIHTTRRDRDDRKLLQGGIGLIGNYYSKIHTTRRDRKDRKLLQ